MKKIVILLSLFLLCGSLCACADGKAESSGFSQESILPASSSSADPEPASSASVSGGVDVNAVFPPEVWKTVDDWSPEPVEFWRQFFALPEQGTDAPGSESQASVLEWLVWFSGKSEEEQKLICYRPEYFGVYPKSVREELAANWGERVSTRVFQMVEKELQYYSTTFWSQFYALPVRGTAWSQETTMRILETLAARAGSTDGRNDPPYAITYPEDTPIHAETQERVSKLDPAIVEAVEEYTYAPGIWWEFQFCDETGVSDETEDDPLVAGERERCRWTMNWLEWFVSLPEDEVKFANYHPFLFTDINIDTFLGIDS